MKCVSSVDDKLQTCVKLKGQLALNRGSLWFLSTASALNSHKWLTWNFSLKYPYIYLANRWWEYSNLSGKSCYPDIKPNSCTWFARNVQQLDGRISMKILGAKGLNVMSVHYSLPLPPTHTFRLPRIRFSQKSRPLLHNWTSRLP